MQYYLEDLLIALVPALAKLPAGLAGRIGLARGKAGRAEGASDGWSAFSTGDAGTAWGDAGWAGGYSDGWSGFSDVGAGMAGGGFVFIIVNLKRKYIES